MSADRNVDVMHCVCNKKDTGGEVFVLCETCRVWYHPECLGITEASARAFDEFHCPACSNKRCQFPNGCQHFKLPTSTMCQAHASSPPTADQIATSAGSYSHADGALQPPIQPPCSGICWDRTRNRWIVAYRMQNQQRSKKYFPTSCDADPKPKPPKQRKKAPEANGDPTVWQEANSSASQITSAQVSSPSMEGNTKEKYDTKVSSTYQASDPVSQRRMILDKAFQQVLNYGIKDDARFAFVQHNLAGLCESIGYHNAQHVTSAVYPHAGSMVSGQYQPGHGPHQWNQVSPTAAVAVPSLGVPYSLALPPPPPSALAMSAHAETSNQAHLIPISQEHHCTNQPLYHPWSGPNLQLVLSLSSTDRVPTPAPFNGQPFITTHSFSTPLHPFPQTMSGVAPCFSGPGPLDYADQAGTVPPSLTPSPPPPPPLR
eukprot:gene707-2506_t